MSEAKQTKLVQQILEIKERSYNKGAAMVLAEMSRLGFKKLAVQIMQKHNLDLEHFETVMPPDYLVIKEAWRYCGLPLKPGPMPEGRPRKDDPRHRGK